MNRGIARRTVFESRSDVRYFLSLLAREVRTGRLRVYAFALLTTHFHLLVSSLQGDISGVMRRVLNRYVRHFNRTRRRDGSLFRGRFRSRPVTSERYLFTLIRYVDQNPIKAGLVRDSRRYAFGSAALHVSFRRPLWLNTNWVDARLGNPEPVDRHARYGAVFCPRLQPSEQALVVARIRNPPVLEDDLDTLLEAAPRNVRAWMERKAALADQTKPGQAYVGIGAVLEEVTRAESDWGEWPCVPGKKRTQSAWPIATVGLMRDLSGATYQQIASALDLPQSTSQVRARQHRHWPAGPPVHPCAVPTVESAMDRTAERSVISRPRGQLLPDAGEPDAPAL